MHKTSSIERVIGARLHNKRNEIGKKAKAFAASVGIQVENLSDFEAGERRIDAKIMLKMCKELGVSARYFFEPLFHKRAASPNNVVPFAV